MKIWSTTIIRGSVTYLGIFAVVVHNEMKSIVSHKKWGHQFVHLCFLHTQPSYWHGKDLVKQGDTSGSEKVSFHMSNMPNKMLWHAKHIAYIPMVQKLSVCTCQTCQIKLMGVGHCFVWCYGYSIYISYTTYPIIPTQTFVIKSPSLYLFSYISF